MINTYVRLVSFNGAISKPVEKQIRACDDYWKLIGLKGTIIETDSHEGRVLVHFENELDPYQVANHNPIKDSLWILLSDLEEVRQLNIYT